MRSFTPSPPQVLMLEHLMKHPLALNFVGMGIGKTATCLKVIDNLTKAKQARGALIIAPLRVINLTWPMEVRQFFPHLKIANLRNDIGRRAFIKGAADIYLINYEALVSRHITLKKRRPPTKEELAELRRGSMPEKCKFKKGKFREFTDDENEIISNGGVPLTLMFFDEQQKVCPGFVEKHLESLKGKPAPFDILVIDESTKIKAQDHKGANQLRRWLHPSDRPARAKRIWALTGTPAPNSLLDLFAQARMVDGGKRLGRSFEHYKQTYFEPEGYMGYRYKAREGSNDQIYERISDITLTLKSSEWLDIPDTVVEDIEVTLPAEILKKYQAFEKELVYQIKHDKEITATNAAALVSKLLQFTSGSMYDEDKEFHHIHDLKIDALRRIVKHTKSPVLVAYAFKHEEARLKKAFPEARFFSDAKTQIAQSLLLDKWNKGQVPILVAHPKSVGHGLNLQHGGNTLVWMTLTYSREDYEQMIARLARRGQDAITQVYRLMCPGTVDDAVAVAIEEKQKTENHLLSALMMLESYRKNGAPVVIAEPEEVDWI